MFYFFLGDFYSQFEMCLNPNPFERPAAAVLYDEVEQLNIDMERENNH